jgi:hypothetical protein
LCAHGHGGQVRACRVLRARARHACDACAIPAADAPSRARRLCRADARSSGEGAARPPLCADEAGESWSGRGHRGCTRRCLCGCPYSGTGIANSPCSWCAVLVEVSSPRPHRRRLQTAVDVAIGNLPHRSRLAKRDSSDARPSKILATRRSYHLCELQYDHFQSRGDAGSMIERRLLAGVLCMHALLTTEAPLHRHARTLTLAPSAALPPSHLSRARASCV